MNKSIHAAGFTAREPLPPLAFDAKQLERSDTASAPREDPGNDTTCPLLETTAQ